MEPHNKHIHSLWIGGQLTALEHLTIRSFLQHGHDFHLWVYDKLNLPPLPGLVLEDASKILPRKKIFRYAKGDISITKTGYGKNSVAGFSDIFRYKLLYEKGGWWVDMDVTCLKPFDFDAPYVFRKHDWLEVVGNIMKCPPHSALMKICYETAVRTLDAFNEDWLKPIRILNDYIVEFNLKSHIQPRLSNHDRWELIVLYYFSSPVIDCNWHAIHWINSVWEEQKLNKNFAVEGSTFAHLLKQYGVGHQLLAQKNFPFWKRNWLHLRGQIIPLLPLSFKQIIKSKP